MAGSYGKSSKFLGESVTSAGWQRPSRRMPGIVPPSRSSTSETTDVVTPGRLGDDRRLGDDDLRSLLDAHGAAMYRLAVSIVRDPALAEDVVQESIIKVWTSLGSFRGESSRRTWIMRITHNSAVSQLRRIRDEAWDPALLPDHQSGDSTEALVDARSDLDRLQIALSELDDLSRAILALREIEAMSYNEIAESLGITLGQVKIRLLRARRLLASEVRTPR